MSTDRLVRWKDAAKSFWNDASDNSIVLEVVISYKCKTQTGEAFEELVNTINSSPVREKVKRVNITDTSYLYRWTIPEFSVYADTSIPTKWFLANKDFIDKLEVEHKLLHWKDGLDDPRMNDWLKKIRVNFAGDEYGNGIIPEFRQAVLEDAEKFAMKGSGSLANCIGFILEESAYTCLHFPEAVMAYPSAPLPSMKLIIDHYTKNFRQLAYSMSNNAQRRSHSYSEMSEINYEIVNFITNTATNVNFFVVDKEGNPIYKNESLGKIVSDVENVTKLSPQVWENSKKVMQDKKTSVMIESDNDLYFLSVKSPLIISNEVEGVIGLSVDITERKKLEILERKKEVQCLAESVVHDIRSPLMVLSLLANDALLPEKKHLALKNIIESIETILEEILAKYKGTNSLKIGREESICVQVAIFESMRLMRYQYADSNVEFDYIPDADFQDESVFIKGNYSDFCRMLTNLINNAVESLKKGSCGVVKIGIKKSDNESVSLFVRDNGCGMPAETVDKLMNRCAVETTKEDGFGLGMQQILKTIDDMHGSLLINSAENVGTEFCLTFPKVSTPEWFCDTLHLKKGNTVIVLDDNRVVFDAWRDVFTTSDVFVKYFTNGRDVLNFIASFDDKSQLFLIADYELRGQESNGVEVIELSGMQDQSLLVTNFRVSEIKSFDELRVKVFPKLLGLDKIKVILE
ncbi:MAG: GHKL domain-containing protein [Alphaproteobacteria bacterium]|nr:GHKL domain-containing protein [Alphaproteobacteria bacterium]